jgi:membrane protease YdiL (CAAX protease family)
LGGSLAKGFAPGGCEVFFSRSGPPGRPKPRQVKARLQLLAVVLGVLPLYSIAVIRHLRPDPAISTGGFIFYLAVISPLAIVIALLLLRFLCGEHPRDLNLKPGRLSSDLLAALILSPLVIIANVSTTYFLSGVVPESASNTSVTNLFAELAGDPGLLVLFLGLLLFLGAASEEVVRVFLLSRLWKLWPSIPGKVAAVVISAGLFGLIHLYQGSIHVVWTWIFGLIMALYYLRFGRVFPLILVHYLTNTIQVVVFVVRAQ